jgi:hypothetical protein
MNLTLIALLTAAGLFFGMLLFLEIGRRIGIARIANNPDGLAKGGSAAEGAVFALLGLLIAFTFSGAASRFEDRRHLITEEANDIGTAYLRVDLLPNDTQSEVRELFRRYVTIRSTSYANLEDTVITKEKFTETAVLQDEIWTKALTACKRSDALPSATMLLLPALNAMIDITTTRTTATQNHPPLIIFFLLTGLGFLSALLVGYDSSDNKERNWLHPVVFAAIMSLTVYVIIDIEFPRLGLIRIAAADQVLVELRKTMK